MLSDLTIHNYRSLQDLHIDGLAQVNLIVGSNNSGKTSLLEAIYLLVNQNNPQSIIDLLDNRGEFAISRHSMSSRGYQIKHLFNNHIISLSENINIQSQNENPLKLQIKLSSTSDEELSQYVYEDESPILTLDFAYNSHTEAKIPVYEDGMLEARFFKTKLPKSLLEPTLQACKFLTTQSTNFNDLSLLWDAINLTPQEDEVIKALQIIEPDVERISFTSSRSNSSVIIKMRGQREPVPLASMGDGMRRLLTLALSAVNVENGVLLIDEIDTGLYYEVQTDMWRLILETAQRLNIQVFATTHSWDCVRAFEEALEDTSNNTIGKLFRLDAKYGKIRAVEYLAEELKIAVQQNIEVR